MLTMKFEIPKTQIELQLIHQLENFFFVTDDEKQSISKYIESAFAACEENFSFSPNKYFWVEMRGARIAKFDPYHSVQYMIFLYYLSNEIYKKGDAGKLCDKIYYLNKMMNSVDLFYAVELPKHFGAEHPLGSVMGRAQYGDNLYFYQNCTIGGTIKDGREVYPVLSDNVQLCSYSAILGDCHIGNNVIIGSGTIIKNQDVPNNSIVFGSSPNLIIKPNRHHSLVI